MSSQRLVELRDARLHGFGRVLLESTNWTVARGRVTVLIGPAGTGKTALLHAIAGRVRGDAMLEGTWLFDGGPYSVATERQVCFVPQAGSGGRRSLADVLGSLELSGKQALFMDEPDHGLSAAALDQLLSRIGEWKRDVTILLITHNLDFARRVGDDVALLCASRLWAAGRLLDVFEEPPNELTRRFLEQGNCWPGPRPPELPSHFHWLIEKQLAGMGKPGLMRSAEEDLEAIAESGVTQLVSLTKEPFPNGMLSGFGIEGRHFPIDDMGIPAVASTVRLCRNIERSVEHGGRVAVHCHAGLGRTGTMLAAYLIYGGAAPEQAISRVRSVNPKYIQSDAQLEFLRRFTG